MVDVEARPWPINWVFGDINCKYRVSKHPEYNILIETSFRGLLFARDYVIELDQLLD